MKNTSLPAGFFDKLVAKAVELIAPSRIILFGSFARGDESEKSDIDLAFEFNGDNGKWAKFKLWVEEEFRSLRDFDLVNAKEADDSIIDAIKREGITIYERKD